MKKEMIKAIRMVSGFNPDLRIKLPQQARSHLFDVIHANYLGIFGLGKDNEFIGTPRPGTDEWFAYERKIWMAVNAVINGCGE